MGARKRIPGGTRTLNLWLRKPTPYPFGHRDTDWFWNGFESGLGCRVSTTKMVRSRGIEPRPPAWKAGILATELRTLMLGAFDGIRTRDLSLTKRVL